MTVTIRLSGEELAETRFAFSPIWELGMSLYKPMRDPSKHALHLPWVQKARQAIEGHDLDLLFAVAPPADLPGDAHAYIPDFLTPPPETPFPEFEEELATVASTPPDVVRSDVEMMLGSLEGYPASELTQKIINDPGGMLPRLVDEMRDYWKLTIEPAWPRIRALHEADVTYRARQLALGGAELLFADFHPMIEWSDGELIIRKSYEASIDPSGNGLLLIPAVFDWPGIAIMLETEQPTLSYSPRGIATLWEDQPPERSGAMNELIGGTRADLLRVLEIPMTTGELARRLHLTPAAVSQQLGVLRRAGVVDARRQGREVYSELTPDGRTLLELLG
jgi:DNA-binding transcriptional ArsR family regulator